MKTKLSLYIIAVVFTIASNITAQEANSKNAIYQYKPEKKLTFDIYLEQSYMLTDWYSNKSINSLYDNLNTSEIGIRLNYKIHSRLGIWTNLSLAARNDRKAPPPMMKIFDEINFDDYYIISNSSSSKKKRYEQMNCRLNIGLYYRYSLKRWTLSPHLGIGFLKADNGFWQSIDMKKINSNEAYSQNLTWMENGDIDDIWLPNIVLQFKTEYKLSNKFSLTGGLTFYQHIQRVETKATLTDNYTHEIVDSWSKKSRFVNSIGINIGISFR